MSAFTSRMWCAVMAGDGVRDARGEAWTVRQVMTDANEDVWAELISPTGEVRLLRVPAVEAWRGALVAMAEGPGWGSAAHGDDAMGWSLGLARVILGGRLTT